MNPLTLLGMTGLNTKWLWHKTQQRARGLSGPPNDMYAERGNPATELDYGEFCELLRESGVSTLRVFGSNWSNPIGSYACAFEPPPHGSYNPWLEALDPNYMGSYRMGQFKSVDDERWPDTNLARFIEAADENGIDIILALFDRVEWDAGWIFNSWNTDCQYIDGRRADPEDRGFLARSRDIFVTEAGWDATRRRIDFLLSAFAGREHVIRAFSVCAEETFYVTPANMGTGSWNAEFETWVERVNNWNLRVQDYLNQRHPAPVGASVAHPADVRQDTVRAKLFDGLAWVGVNWYDFVTPASARGWLREVQARYPDAISVVQQYHPDGAAVRTEPPPYLASLELEFTSMCAGGVGSFRWLDRYTGTMCTPQMRKIAGITRNLVQAARFKEWTNPRSWDERVVGAPFIASCGDGAHVVGYGKWQGDSQAFTVSGLVGKQVMVHAFDILTGNQVNEKQVALTNGNAVFTVPGEGQGAFCIVPLEGPTPEPVRTIRVRAEVEIDGEPDGVFEGELEEVAP